MHLSRIVDDPGSTSSAGLGWRSGLGMNEHGGFVLGCGIEPGLRGLSRATPRRPASSLRNRFAREGESQEAAVARRRDLEHVLGPSASSSSRAPTLSVSRPRLACSESTATSIPSRSRARMRASGSCAARSIGKRPPWSRAHRGRAAEEHLVRRALRGNARARGAGGRRRLPSWLADSTTSRGHRVAR